MPTVAELKSNYDGIKSQIESLTAQRSDFPKTFKREITNALGYKFVVELSANVDPIIKAFAPNGVEIIMPDVPSSVFLDWARAKKRFEDWINGAPDITL